MLIPTPTFRFFFLAVLQYESSITFGVRKQLQAEQGRAELEAAVGGLDDSKKLLEVQVRSRIRRFPPIQYIGLQQVRVTHLVTTCRCRSSETSSR